MSDKMSEFEENLKALSLAIASSGVKVVEAMRNIGHDVIETPDGALCHIVDAPEMEPLSWSDYSNEFLHRQDL